MSDKKSNLSVTHKWELEYPKKEVAYLVPKSDWKHLRKRVERIKSPSTIFLTIGSVLLGVAGTAFIGALTLPDVGGYKPIICWAVFAVSLICGGLSLFFHRFQRKQETDTRKDIIECIDEIEEKYQETERQASNQA